MLRRGCDEFSSIARHLAYAKGVKGGGTGGAWEE